MDAACRAHLLRDRRREEVDFLTQSVAPTLANVRAVVAHLEVQLAALARDPPDLVTGVGRAQLFEADTKQAAPAAAGQRAPLRLFSLPLPDADPAKARLFADGIAYHVGQGLTKLRGHEEMLVAAEPGLEALLRHLAVPGVELKLDRQQRSVAQLTAGKLLGTQLPRISGRVWADASVVPSRVPGVGALLRGPGVARGPIAVDGAAAASAALPPVPQSAGGAAASTTAAPCPAVVTDDMEGGEAGSASGHGGGRGATPLQEPAPDESDSGSASSSSQAESEVGASDSESTTGTGSHRDDASGSDDDSELDDSDDSGGHAGADCEAA